jgi:hypothetical protein
MEKIKNEKELLKKLYSDIDHCEKEKIVLFGGHFPLLYPVENVEVIESFNMWGIFSIYSLELVCKVGKYAKKKGKNVEFVFFVDDHMYEDMTKLSATPRKRRRNRLYLKRSEPNAILPETYQKIMKKYGFSEKNVLRHNHQKRGRENCLYFSEKILRKSKMKIDNPCAREYTEFIEDKKYFNKKDSYLITFGPQRCRENICNFALDKYIKELSASHVFMDTAAKLATRKQLYSVGNGITYRKD